MFILEDMRAIAYIERMGSNFKNIATGEWIRACTGGERASCNFDVGGLLAEVVLLGNIAIRRSKKLSGTPPT